MTTGLNLTVTSNGQVVIGSAGDDTITNDGFDDVVMRGAGGNDSITSDGYSDTIHGGIGANTISITGTGTNNEIYGGNGSIDDASISNTLFTYALGSHNDTLGSHDILVARDGTVDNHVITTTVSNFVSGDIIELSISHGDQLITSANLSSIVTSHIADNTSGSAVLTLGGETITFTGVHTSALTASDFALVA
jgi:hypothetical protein